MAPPINDNYASPTVLSSSGGSSSGLTTREATFETGTEVQLAYKDQSIWFTFTPTTTGWYRFAFPRSSITYNGVADLSWGELRGMLRQSSVITDFTATSPIDSFATTVTNTREPALHGFLTSGTTYTIKVYSGLGSSPDTADKRTVTFDFEWSAIAPPANDNFVNAETLGAAPGTTSGTTYDATQEAGEPELNSGTEDASVWYEFTPSTTGTYIFTIPNSSLVYVGHRLTGSSWGSLRTWLFQETAVADCTSANAIDSSVTAFTDDSTPNDAVLIAVLTSGLTYQIKVAASQSSSPPPPFNQHSVDFDLEWEFIPAPSNDDFADRIVITGESGSQPTIEMRGATDEVNEPVPYYWYNTPGNTAWYEWTAPSSGRYLFSFLLTNGSIAVYTGSTLAGSKPAALSTELMRRFSIQPYLKHTLSNLNG